MSPLVRRHRPRPSTLRQPCCAVAAAGRSSPLSLSRSRVLLLSLFSACALLSPSAACFASLRRSPRPRARRLARALGTRLSFGRLFRSLRARLVSLVSLSAACARFVRRRRPRARLACALAYPRTPPFQRFGGRYPRAICPGAFRVVLVCVTIPHGKRLKSRLCVHAYLRVRPTRAQRLRIARSTRAALI